MSSSSRSERRWPSSCRSARRIAGTDDCAGGSAIHPMHPCQRSPWRDRSGAGADRHGRCPGPDGRAYRSRVPSFAATTNGESRAPWHAQPGTGTLLAEAPAEAFEIVEGNVYFPPDAVKDEFVRPSDTHTICGWKGTASYYDVVVKARPTATRPGSTRPPRLRRSTSRATSPSGKASPSSSHDRGHAAGVRTGRDSPVRAAAYRYRAVVPRIPVSGSSVSGRRRRGRAHRGRRLRSRSGSDKRRGSCALVLVGPRKSLSRTG